MHRCGSSKRISATSNCKQGSQQIGDSILFKSSSQTLIRASDDPESAPIDEVREAKKVVEFMYKCWQEGRLSDTLLHVDSGEIQAHKIVMAAYSEELAQKLEEFKMGDIIAIDLTDFPHDVVTNMLEFMYTTKLRIDDSNVVALLVLGKELRIELIIKRALDYLSNYNVNNCIMVYLACKDLVLSQLQTGVLDYIKTNHHRVTRTNAFLSLSIERLHLLLIDLEFSFGNDLEMFLALVRWLDYDRVDRMEHASFLMAKVPFFLIKPEELVTRVEKFKFIFEDIHCHMLLYNAMRYHALQLSNSSLAAQSLHTQQSACSNLKRHQAVCNLTHQISPSLYESPTLGNHCVSQPSQPVSKSLYSPRKKRPPSQHVSQPCLPSKHCQSLSNTKKSLQQCQCGDGMSIPSSNTNQNYSVSTPKNSWMHAAAQIKKTMKLKKSGDDSSDDDSSSVTVVSSVSHDESVECEPMYYSPLPFPLPGRKYCSEIPGRKYCSSDDCSVASSDQTLSLLKSRSLTRQPPRDVGLLVFFGGINLQRPQAVRAGRSYYSYAKDMETWSFVGSTNEALHHHGAICVNNKIYVIGGCSYSKSTHESLGKATRHTYLMTVGRCDWKALAPMKSARAYHSVATDGSYIYAIGGENDRLEKLNSIERYDTVKDRWNLFVYFQHGPKLGTAAAVFKEKLFMVGGYTTGPSTTNPLCADVECYSLTKQRWVKLRPIPVARCHASLVVCGNLLYLLGGRAWNMRDCVMASLGSVEVYNDRTDTWKHLADMTVPRHDAGCTVADNRFIYIVGGMQSPNPQCLDSVECFDTLTKEWLAVPRLPEPVTGLACIAN